MGLLDSLQDPSNALGLSLLAAGSPTTDPNQAGFGMRLNNAVVDATDKTLKQQSAAAALFAAKQKAALLGLAMQDAGGLGVGSPGAVLGGGAAPSQAQGGAVGSPGAVVAPLSAPQGGSSGGAVATPVAPQGSPGSGLFNPRTAALLKLGGEADILPNIQAMQPKWEFHDGVAIDVNPITNPSFKGGPQGFISKSADGKVIQGAMGADGQMHVAPVDGAVSAFSQFENASNQSKARNTESRQPVIGPGGRPVSQSVYDAVNGVTPPAAGGPVSSTAPVNTGNPNAPTMPAGPRPMIGGQYASPGLAGGTTGAAAGGQRDILTGELTKTQAVLAQAQAAGDAAGAARAQQDIAGIQREISRLPGGSPAPMIGPGAGALPPPSPVVAGSGGASVIPGTPGRTNFLATPGQGVGVAGGTSYGPTEQAAQKAAAAGAEEQAKLTAKAEANPNETMKTSWANLQAKASSVPTALDLIQAMKEKSATRNAGSTSYLGALPGGINPSQDAYDKARAQLMPMVDALNAGQNGATDASRAVTAVAVPGYGISQEPQGKALQDLENQFKAVSLRNQLLEPHFNQGNGQAYTQLETELNANLTPKVAGIVTMPNSAERAAAIADIKKNDPATADRLRWAIKQGLLK